MQTQHLILNKQNQNIVLTYDKSHEATATAESQAVTSMYKSESTLYTSELAGNTHAVIEKSEYSSLDSHTTSVSATPTSQAIAILKSLLSLQALQALLHLRLQKRVS